MPGQEGTEDGVECSRSREKRRSEDDGSDGAVAAKDVTVPAAVPPASTSPGMPPISGHATKGTSAADLKPGEAGTDIEESGTKENLSSNDRSAGHGAGRCGQTKQGQEDDDHQTSPSNIATTTTRGDSLPVRLPSTTDERSTARPSDDTTSGLSAGSSTSTARKSKEEGKDIQPSKQEADKLTDKGKRRADDESIDIGPHEHEERRAEELDDTKLSNPNLREATELAALPPFSSSSSSSASGAGSRLSQRRIHGSEDEPGGDGGDALSQPQSATGSGSNSMRNLSGPLWWQAVQRWWKRHVSVTVEVKGMRDHLGKQAVESKPPIILFLSKLRPSPAVIRSNQRPIGSRLPALERTFLGYLRTSIALSMTGVILAQLFRLQHSLHPDAHLGFFVLGIPLASTFIACAIAVALLGAFRFWRQQSAIVRGKVLAGGWEVLVIMVGSLLVCVMLLVLVALA
ncbi:hypothetical protein IWX90DRAFT_505224 [Phyllosticta citrichinensis]|uniref:DUF202 domain-containing protein n=1 Tax=Phyllosticta citrichinensis TaxID=1130410 RepID=A0ABR1XRC8_9PEZI